MSDLNLCGSELPSQVQDLPLGGRFQLISAYVADDLAQMAQLCAAFAFEERSIVLFGKPVLQPRLISWAGELPYTYSGDTLSPRPFPSPLVPLLDRVNATLFKLAPGAPPFNHVLLNLYRDGADSMGLHSDDENELGADPWIASLSFGAARCFQIAPKRKHRVKGAPAEKRNISLPSGSLLLMEPPMQRYYLHGLQKTKRPVGARLNLTFRGIVPR